jgi:hypothetical protein
MEEAIRGTRHRRELRRLRALGGRESKAQAIDSRSEPGQEDAAGRDLTKTLRPAVKRVLVKDVQVVYRVAERRACRVLGFAQSSFRSRTRRHPRGEVCVRLRDLAASRVHYGHRRLWVFLRREGWLVNKKLVDRLSCEKGLGFRRRRPRRRKSVQVRRHGAGSGRMPDDGPVTGRSGCGVRSL